MKTLHEISTISSLRSMHSIGARSVPKAQRSPYLDLYTFKKEKERLEKQTISLDKKKQITGRSLSDINKLIAGLQEEIRKDGETKTVKYAKTSSLRTMPVRY